MRQQIQYVAGRSGSGVRGFQHCEVCEMQTAKTLLEIYRDRGARGLPLHRVYRQLFNPDLFLRSYGKIYRNDGAMTPGVTPETPDGMSMEKIHTIITALQTERYVWKPVRRTQIPKK